MSLDNPLSVLVFVVVVAVMLLVMVAIMGSFGPCVSSGSKRYRSCAILGVVGLFAMLYLENEVNAHFF